MGTNLNRIGRGTGLAVGSMSHMKNDSCQYIYLNKHDRYTLRSFVSTRGHVFRYVGLLAVKTYFFTACGVMCMFTI